MRFGGHHADREPADTIENLPNRGACQPRSSSDVYSAGTISPAPESPEMLPFVPLSLGEHGAVSGIHPQREELAAMDVAYRKDGALEVINRQRRKGKMNTAIALQHGAGLIAEALSAEQVRRMNDVVFSCRGPILSLEWLS